MRARRAVSGWATAISAGPANEAARPSNFIVTNNNNALFSTQPAVVGQRHPHLHPGRQRQRLGDRDGQDPRQRRHRQRWRGREPDPDVHDHREPGERRAELHQGRRPDGERGCGRAVGQRLGDRDLQGTGERVGQAVDFIVTNNNNALFSTQPAVAANGTLTYTPAANANGSATVTVKIHDDGGTANGGVDTARPRRSRSP